jgi:hypothetical protein
LAQHPELMKQIERLLDEAENRAGALTTADAAEEALIGRPRQIGQAGLSGWAERETARLAAESPPGARRGSKKVRWLSTFGWVEVREQT